MSTSMPVFCEQCGARLTPGAAFCESCGAKVKRPGPIQGPVTGPVSATGSGITVIPFQRPDMGPFAGRLCTLALSPAGVTFVRNTPEEEKAHKKIERELETLLIDFDVSGPDGFWEVASERPELCLPRFRISPPLSPVGRNLLRDVFQGLRLPANPWQRICAMDPATLARDGPDTSFTPYDRISEIADVSTDPETFGLTAGGNGSSWCTEAHTFSLVKSALTEGLYRSLAAQARLDPEKPEPVCGVIPGCVNVTSGNIYKADCIVTPVRIVFIDPKTGSWEEVTKSVYAGSPEKTRIRTLSPFEEVTGTRWHDPSEPRATSAVGSVPGTPWEALMKAPVQDAIEASVSVLMVPVREIGAITVTPEVTRQGGLFYMQKVTVDEVLVTMEPGNFSFDLPPGSGEYCVEILSKALLGRVSLR